MQTKPMIILILALFLTHCASYDFSRRVVQQGNLLSQSKIETLKVGMSKETVSQHLGTSLVPELFDNDQWDYAFTLKKGNNPMIIRHVSLTFRHDRLVKIIQ